MTRSPPPLTQQVKALAERRWTDKQRTDHVLESSLYTKYLPLGDENEIVAHVSADPANTPARRELFNQLVSEVWKQCEAEASTKRNEILAKLPSN